MTNSREAAGENDMKPSRNRLPGETLTGSARYRPSFQMVDTTVTLLNVGGMTGPRVDADADAETKVRRAFQVNRGRPPK